MTVEAHGLTAWSFSPGSVSVSANVKDTGRGICVSDGRDDTFSVNVYSDGEKAIGVLVYDDEGVLLAGYGLVPAIEVAAK